MDCFHQHNIEEWYENRNCNFNFILVELLKAMSHRITQYVLIAECPVQRSRQSYRKWYNMEYFFAALFLILIFKENVLHIIAESTMYVQYVG